MKSAYLYKDKIIIDGSSYDVENLHRLPPGLKPDEICVREDEKTLIFWHEQSPLSNFHPADFILDGEPYNCVEQFYCSKMAATFGDQDSVNRIMAAKIPAKQKEEAKKIKGFVQSQWDMVKYDTMKTGVQAKFNQNTVLRDYLISTSDKTLGEPSAKDKTWGIGLI